MRGYYALPLLWGEAVIGWANVGQAQGRLSVELGYVGGRPPRGAAYRQALDEELDRLRRFLSPR